MPMSKEDGVGIDIDGLVSSIGGMVPDGELMPLDSCIFKIPIILSRHNVNAFSPDAFSIGPLHRKNNKLKATEKIKAKYLNDLISRSNSGDKKLRNRISSIPKKEKDKKLKALISSIAKKEKEARKYYAEPLIDCNANQLVEILVIDGCFLIELLCKFADESLQKEGDSIFGRSIMFQFLRHDLILLENQVPWMVLETLVDVIKDSRVHKPDLVTHAVKFLKSIFLTYRIDPKSDQCINMTGIKHFVDLFYILSNLPSTEDTQSDQWIIIKCVKHLVDTLSKLAALSSTLFRKLAALSSIKHLVDRLRKLAALSSIKYLVDTLRKLAALSSTSFRKLSNSSSTLLRKLSNSSSAEEKKKRQREWELPPSATVLVEAGIKFKRATSGSLLDVKFKDGVLEIPPFIVHHLTETIFRNLISYEQCYPYCGYKFTSYAILLDSLINTDKDINILCDHQIIDNRLNPEDAAQIFNKLYHDTAVNYFEYKDLSSDVNSFCQRRLPRWRAVLLGKYFNTPWAGISTFAAIILLIMTFLQTLYGMKK